MTACVVCGECRDHVTTMHLGRGDVLVVRMDSMWTTAAIEKLARRLDETGCEGVTIVAATGGVELEQLDEERMRAHGWVRAGES